MTPLAAFLAKQIISRPKHREPFWRDENTIKRLDASLSDIHCFEVSECFEMMLDLVAKFLYDRDAFKVEELFADYGFLPAPKTWIEWRDSHHSNPNHRGIRVGILFEQIGDFRAKATFYHENKAQPGGFISLRGQVQEDPEGKPRIPAWLLPDDEVVDLAHPFVSYAQVMLALINSPHIIGRRSHDPNRALARKLMRQSVGSFPLRAWTELLLQINKPPEIDDGEPHESQLTGQRAFHFVRKHIRIKLGRLEFVSAHWRGDIALGVKQTRYVAVPYHH
jgi:hypothetical protein